MARSVLQFSGNVVVFGASSYKNTVRGAVPGIEENEAAGDKEIKAPSGSVGSATSSGQIESNASRLADCSR